MLGGQIEKETKFGKKDFVAGALSLDFVNTVGGLRGARSDDRLWTYDGLAAFAAAAGLLNTRQSGLLRSLARIDPAGAETALAEAKAVRETLYGIFKKLAERERLLADDLTQFNAVLGKTLRHATLNVSGGSLAWGWAEWGKNLSSPLWPLVRDAADLLSSPRAKLIRQCRSETCGWLFLDQTKNRSRRWCDMRVCGNRAKARRHRARRQVP